MAGLLRKFVKAWSEVPVEPYSIIIDDQPVIVNFRRNSRAKRIILRLTRDAKASGPVYLSPSLSTKGTRLSFVKGNRLYLEAWLWEPATRNRFVEAVSGGAAS